MGYLTPEQVMHIVDQLKDHRGFGVLITYLPEEVSSHQLAHNLLDVLKRAGWEVQFEDPPTNYTLPFTGLSVGVSDACNPTQGARLLLDILLGAGISVTPTIPLTNVGISRSGCRTWVAC